MNEVERKLDELLAGLNPEGDLHFRKALIAWFWAGVNAKTKHDDAVAFALLFGRPPDCRDGQEGE